MSIADPMAVATPTSSITSWTRLEPRTRSADLGPAVEARIADPAWLLARQWQLGEFAGEDAGTPIVARVHAEAARISRYRPGAYSGTTVGVPAGLPLEAVVERESVATAGDLRWAAETGQQLLRLLAQHGAAAAGPLITARYPLPVRPSDAASAADARTVGYLRIMAGRVPHGLDALRAHARNALIGEAGIPAGSVAALNAALAEWLTWLGVPARPPGPPAGHLLQLPAVIKNGVNPRPQQAPWPEETYFPLVSAPGQEGAAWRRERMEHDFAVGARDSGGEIVLRAEEYDGDRLDWYHLDQVPGETLLTAAEATDVVRVVLPAPAAYLGMPAQRFWELEDSRVNLAGVTAGTADLARMLVLEYGLVYAGDHFVIPLRLPTGTVTSIRSLVVTDTFGVATLVPAAPDGGGCALFRPAATDGGDPPDVLVLPDTVTATLTSEPVEEVRFGRDETANLAWAVERVVAGATGRGIDRDAQVQRAAVPPRAAPPSGTDMPEASYAFATTVPENWVPLIPGPVEGRPDRVGLHRTRLQQATRDGSIVAVTGLSRVLDWRLGADGRPVPLALPEEEVGRAGTRVVRRWQLARSADGSVRLWLGRSRHTGGGGLASGLRYDAVDPLENDA